MILILSTGCRPVEARKTLKSHFSYNKAAKQYSLSLPKEITKTTEDYNWKLPQRFNHVWSAMSHTSEELKRLTYDQVRDTYIEYQERLGISTKFTMKSSRKMIATNEYASHMRQGYLKEGGKAL